MSLDLESCREGGDIALGATQGLLPRGYLPEVVLTPSQVADWLQVSTKTLATLPIRSKKLGHRTRRYVAGDVLEYLSGPQHIRRAL